MGPGQDVGRSKDGAGDLMLIQELIGYLGGIFIMISFVPQVIKSYRTKSVADLSLWMIIATLIGTVFWIIYGFLIDSKPVQIMNIIFGVVVLFQLYLKIRYGE